MKELDTPHSAVPDDILDEGQAADLLQIETRTLRLWRATRGVPHYKPTRKVVRFSRRDLLSWLERSRVAITRGPSRRRGQEAA